MQSILADTWPFNEPPGSRWRPLKRRRGDIATTFSGTAEVSPIPENESGGNPHAGHIGTMLLDDSGRPPNIRGRSYWLCLEHDVAVLAPRA